MAEVLSRESRLRLFLLFLILVLVVVNSQSLLVSRRARDLTAQSFRDAARARAEEVASHLGGEPYSSELAPLLSIAERKGGLLSACIVDENLYPVAGSPRCGFGATRDVPDLDPSQHGELADERWVMTDLRDPYDPDHATAFGYLGIGEGALLRVEVPARALAELNRSLRATLIYQGAGVILLLVAVFLFVNSQFARHRRLMAEARSVAGDLASPADTSEEGQFLLNTLQMVVARLKEKERQLAEMHQREKARADETEALATDIIRSMTTGLVSLDETGHVAIVNPAAERIFGVTAKGLVRRHFAEALPGSEDVSKWVRAAFSAGEFSLRRSVEYRRAAGDTIHLGASVLPLRTGEGPIRGALCLFADLTEVIELRERLILKENLARLGEVAAGIAHEIRNSLATILGNAKLLKRAGIGTEASALVEALAEEGAAMSRVVTEFLVFARPEKLRIEPFDLSRMASELARDLTPLADEAGVRLHVQGASCEVEADEMLVRKAVKNLVLNAIEASAASEPEKGGEVTIEVARDGTYGVVRVVDEGVGIHEENLPRIFAPFFTTKPKGTGLGLAMVQKVAISHNGRIDVARRAERGTLFTLRLPFNQEPSGAEEWV